MPLADSALGSRRDDSKVATSNDRIIPSVPTARRESSSVKARALRARLMPVAALSGIILMALNLRAAVTSLPPLIEQMRADITFTPALVGLLGSLAPLAFAAAGLAGTLLLRRISAELIAVLLLLITAAGQLVRPWSPGAAVFISISAITLLALGIGNVIMPALVKAWFPRRIGLVTAAYTTVMAIGTAVPALIAVPLAGSTPALGWRLGLGIWGLMALAAVPSWVIAVRRPRALPPPRLLENPGTASNTVRPRSIAVHRSPIAWGLSMLFIANSMNLYAMFTWLPIRLADAGLSEASAGAHLALFAGIGIVPSLLVPGLAARGHTFALAAGCVVAFVAGYLGLLLSPAHLTTLWTMIGGLGGGSFPLVLTMIGLRSATPATAGAVSAFVQTVGYCGAMTGPLIFGLLHGATGGWTASFGFLLLSMLLMLAGAWITRTPATVDDDLRRRTAGREERQVPVASLEA